MADGRHIENCVGRNSSSGLSDFSEILRGEAVYHRLLALGHTPAFHRTYFLFSYMQFGLPGAGAFRVVSDTLVYFHFNGLWRRAPSLSSLRLRVLNSPVDLCRHCLKFIYAPSNQ